MNPSVVQKEQRVSRPNKYVNYTTRRRRVSPSTAVDAVLPTSPNTLHQPNKVTKLKARKVTKPGRSLSMSDIYVRSARPKDTKHPISNASKQTDYHTFRIEEPKANEYPSETERRKEQQVQNDISLTSQQQPIQQQFERKQSYEYWLYEQPVKNKRIWLHRVIYVFGVLVFMTTLGVSVQTFLLNAQADEKIEVLAEQTYRLDENGVEEGTGSDPAETEISDDAILKYIPKNPREPRYIQIPSINVLSRVKSLGNDPKTGAVDAPHNIYDAGWYNQSVLPGEDQGTALIVGHVSGWTAPGVFKKITSLELGSIIIVENGEGDKFEYSVTNVETIPLSQINMNKVLATEKAGKHDIKLMTCGGEYNNKTDEYEARTIVTATQIN